MTKKMKNQKSENFWPTIFWAFLMFLLTLLVLTLKIQNNVSGGLNF
jgi:uncharacterized membrane protein YbhN (UPF0104 family)